ncbi:ATP phosphoribosyltransferase regulatory subunit [Deinococcus ruber]|uniref:ATP phosphoribosyltransferase regulatory subunit n=1 Tax=Deinococcus ruber TaxID=1848197 RepID=A0A918C0V5_9DEIO|nr:ATP phosphoribosyltransferase regulatory subunit [Deinococcus ruber]GGQ98606.1 ATP phosphoribosyltransferase regulatory subunit [Deinococcus ruber]
MILPLGTRDVLPPEWAWREHLRNRLAAHFSTWGYQGVELPALELHDPQHPQDARAFKLIDRGGDVLMLRSEFTTAVQRLVRTRFPGGPFPLRLQYGGRLWLAGQASELGRLREFTQLGVELIGASTPWTDAELLELSLSALKCVGVQGRLEVGHPGFLDALLEDSGLSESLRTQLHGVFDRKSGPDLAALIRRNGLDAGLERTLTAVNDLYGGPKVLAQARRLPLGARAAAALNHLERVADLFGRERLLFDLGMSRRYGYYSGFTFRAYADGFSRQILGGGRYGGHDSSTPPTQQGAGFALGLERLTEVAARHIGPEPEVVLALDLAGADYARSLGLIAELRWTDDAAELARYTALRGIRRAVQGETLGTVAELLEVRA